MAEATPIQLLRSEVLEKRPDPSKLLKGQPAVNVNSQQPGLFLSDETGTNLFKVGPCAVGTQAPNSVSPNPASVGNCKGELWLDTSVTAEKPFPVLKVWTGTEWVSSVPFIYSRPLIAATAPNIATVQDGTQWWNSTNGLMYIAYNDGNSKQWVQIGSSPVS